MFWLCLSEFGVGLADIRRKLGSEKVSDIHRNKMLTTRVKLTDAEVLWSIVFVTLGVFEAGLLLSLLTPELLTMVTSAALQILISSSPINHHSHWSLITQNNSLYCHWAACAPGVILAAFLGHLSLIMQLMVTEMSRVHTMWTMTTITLATPGTHFLRWPNTEEDNHQFYALASFLRSNWYWYQQMHFTDKWITFKGREIKTIW